ncbi:carbohydrate kinase family protein [Planosporangium sp. 12N6]
MTVPRDLDVVVLGEINPDLILTGPDVEPVFGQVERLVDDANLTVGSSGAIFACGAARLGLRTAMVGLVGDDPFGAFMVDQLRRRDVRTEGIVVSETVSTGLTVILNRGADRAILTHLGAMGAMSADMVDRALLARARHVHVTSYFMQRALQPGLPGLLAEFRAAGGTVSVDTNYDPDERWGDGIEDVLRCADVLLPNEAEALALSGSPDVPAAAAALSRLVPTVVVKRGEHGAYAYADGETVAVPSPPTVPVDTTGAGDSFDAGYLFGWLTGRPLRRRLELAVACGSLSTRQVGGTAGQPTADQALGLAVESAR